MNTTVDSGRYTANSKSIEFGPWHISYDISCILPSVCSTKVVCERDDDQFCQFCIYCKELTIPHLPDMVFPKNILSLEHTSGAKISFNPLDALRCVADTVQAIEVACAEAWQESRLPIGSQICNSGPRVPSGRLSLPPSAVGICEVIPNEWPVLLRPNAERQKKTYDWTFSTDYKGTLSGRVEVEDTEDSINFELLKQKDQMLFYQDLTLFEDELHDHGISKLSVKIRVMPSYWYILLRFFLRVDDMMVRSHETRLFHMLGTDYVLREFTTKEALVKDLNVPTTQMREADDIIPLLPVREKKSEKLIVNFT